MISVNTHEAKTRLSALLALVEEGSEEVTICRNGKPVAKLVAVQEAAIDPMEKHPELQGAAFLEDPCAPLDEEAWPEEWR